MSEEQNSNIHSSSPNGRGCGCCGCLPALVIGTLIVGTIAVGGVRKAWHKLESTWDYDNRLQTVQKAFDVNSNGVLDDSERLNMYQTLRLPTITNEIPSVKIPYETLLNFTHGGNQER